MAQRQHELTMSQPRGDGLHRLKFRRLLVTPKTRLEGLDIPVVGLLHTRDSIGRHPQRYELRGPYSATGSWIFPTRGPGSFT